MKLSKKFTENIQLYFKDEGMKWLKNLPRIISNAENNWNLTINEPYTLSVNYVASAQMKDTKEVVIKICANEEGFQDEVEALSLLGKEGLVQPLDVNTTNHTMLLEKISPGKMLAEITDDRKACYIAAEVMKKITVPAPLNCNIPTTKDREMNLYYKVRENPNGIGPISKNRLQKALEIFTNLNNSIDNYWLLHGDFHHYNILSKGKEWVAIDPKGLIGEKEYDLIQFLLNCLPEKNVYETIKQRVEILTKELHLNKERIILWGYCHTVLATSWTVDNQGNYDHTFFQGIEIFEKLYKEWRDAEQ